MAVNDELLAAAARNDHVAYELIDGWSFSAGARLGGSEVPGMWMTGSAMRLLERCREGVLSIDLLACHRYANGLGAAQAVRCPKLAILAARDVMAPVRNAQALVAALSDAAGDARRGHSMMAERPGDVLDALRPFL
jgi:pimeloyl-ACP methyl ester carboxylesterase